MKRLELFYPVKPHKVNRVWGFVDKVYEQFNFKRHNGIDLALTDGQPIYAPFGGSVINVGNEPRGSGIFVSLISDEEYSFDDGKTAHVLLDFFHCQEIKVNVGDSVAMGQLIALGDNTGCSTGSHTHIQPRREILTQLSNNAKGYRVRNINYGLCDLDVNDANGTFDPEPYWNKKYAVDNSSTEIARLEQVIKGLHLKIAELNKNNSQKKHIA